MTFEENFESFEYSFLSTKILDCNTVAKQKFTLNISFRKEFFRKMQRLERND